LSAAIRRLLSDEPLARTLGLNARARVEQRFSADRMVEGMIKVYAETLTRGNLRTPSAARS